MKGLTTGWKRVKAKQTKAGQANRGLMSTVGMSCACGYKLVLVEMC